MNFKKEITYLFEKKTTALAIFLITVLGLIIYANSLTGQFIWDDGLLVTNNLYIRSWHNLDKIFTENIWTGSGAMDGDYYRPLHIASYIIDYSLWGLNVIGYHLISILLHILVALCVYWLILTLLGDKLVALLAGIFFISHPVQAETIASISIRGDLLSALFILLCFIFYIKLLSADNIGSYLIVILSYVLAVLSKENSLVLPFLVLLYHYVFGKKVRLGKFAPLLIIAFAYLLLRTAVLKSAPLYTYMTTGILDRIPSFFVAITNYIRILILPFDLHTEYGEALFSFTDPKAVLGIIMSSVLLIWAFKKRKTDKLVFFSILWFFLALLPVSNIYPIGFYMAEHYLYLPSIGFFLLMAYGLNKLLKIRNLKKIIIAVIISLVIFYSCLTVRQNDYWREPVSFFERTLRYAPDSPRIKINLGALYSAAGRHKEAIYLLNNALKAEAADVKVKAYHNLGYAYFGIGDKEKAIEAYNKTIEINPNYADGYFNLGVVYSAMGMREKAMEEFKKTLQVDPKYAKAYNRLGLIYKDMKNDEDAITFFKKAVEINPYFNDAYFNLGVSYANIGRKEEAIKSYETVVKRDPGYADAYYNLGTLYKDTGRRELAVSALAKAIEADPTYAKAYNNLGVLFRDAGKNEEAIKLFDKAAKIDSTYAMAYYNLSISYFQVGQYDLAIKYCDKARDIGCEVDAKFLKLLESFRHQTANPD